MTTPLGGTAAVEAVGAEVGVLLREAMDADVAGIAAIYAHHVAHGTGTFDEVAPDRAEMARRWRSIADLGLPYLVAARGEDVIGFAYAAPFRPRSAYRFTVEDSIYLHPAAMGQGVGGRLLGGVIDTCEALGLRQMIAVIGDADNARSIRLHRRLGFRHAGVLTAAGLKFGRWLDAVFMQRTLGAGATSRPGD